MLREFGRYRFYSKDNKFVTITNKDTKEEHTVPVLEALNFYNDLVAKYNQGADISINNLDFLKHLMYQLTKNIILLCGNDFAPEWSKNYDVKVDSDLNTVVIGHYFDEQFSPGDYVQYYLYPVSSQALGYGVVFQIQYSSNIIWELQVTSKSAMNFDGRKEIMPKRATFTLPDVAENSPNIVCSKVQDLIIKMIKIAINELVMQ